MLPIRGDTWAVSTHASIAFAVKGVMAASRYRRHVHKIPKDRGAKMFAEFAKLTIVNEVVHPVGHDEVRLEGDLGGNRPWRRQGEPQVRVVKVIVSLLAPNVVGRQPTKRALCGKAGRAGPPRFRNRWITDDSVVSDEQMRVVPQGLKPSMH